MPPTHTRYDDIGTSYARTRQPDPRVEARLLAGLGDAQRIVNIGAGAGSYEPAGRTIVAVEPSPTMLAQRPAEAAPAVRADAEHLPFRDAMFDAALAIFTLHHWSDIERGLRELARVSARQVILTYDAIVEQGFWLIDDYFPEVAALDNESRGHTSPAVAQVLAVREVVVMPVPSDCVDGFMAAYWARPEAYLDPVVQAGISGLARLAPDVRARGTARLGADLASGEWDARHGHLRAMTEIDVGYRIIVAGA
jgi:ubiquinone/menaquinone biosynthesis C-methylase UbiE